jgi:hypothetical protein
MIVPASYQNLARHSTRELITILTSDDLFFLEDLDDARHLAEERYIALEPDFLAASDSTRSSVLALARALDRGLTRYRFPNRTIARADRSALINRVRNQASDIVGNLDSAASYAGDIRGQGERERVTSSAVHVVNAAVRLLPLVDRPRYAEEYLSELRELAHSGGGRLRQLPYAFRQFVHVIPMNSALHSPRRRGAVP